MLYPTKAHTVAKKLVQEWISRYGVMKQLHTDQGKSLENEVLKELTDILRIKKTRTTPYHPQSDGMVERLNRTLKDMLAKTGNDHDNHLGYLDSSNITRVQDNNSHVYGVHTALHDVW